jgi:spore coat protein U-like protein
MRRKRFFLAFAVMVVVTALGAGRAHAQWGGTCTISTTLVSFGVYNVFRSSNLVSTGTISYTCRGDTANVYGFVPAEQDVPVGTYNDWVVATRNF